jgi:hypothetical protein
VLRKFFKPGLKKRAYSPLAPSLLMLSSMGFPSSWGNFLRRPSGENIIDKEIASVPSQSKTTVFFKA